MPRCAARRVISSSLIHTYPGPPVQQLPQHVHVNERPSAYQGSLEGMTSSFISTESYFLLTPGSNRTVDPNLQLPRQQQHDHDQQHQSQPTYRVIPKATAIR